MTTSPQFATASSTCKKKIIDDSHNNNEGFALYSENVQCCIIQNVSTNKCNLVFNANENAEGL